jgi:hypothetical protein
MAVNVDRTLIAERVTRPAEALNVEIKTGSIQPHLKAGRRLSGRHSRCATATAASW